MTHVVADDWALPNLLRADICLPHHVSPCCAAPFSQAAAADAADDDDVVQTAALLLLAYYGVLPTDRALGALHVHMIASYV